MPHMPSHLTSTRGHVATLTRSTTPCVPAQPSARHPQQLHARPMYRTPRTHTTAPHVHPTPQPQQAHPKVRELMYPVLQADFQLVETYQVRVSRVAPHDAAGPCSPMRPPAPAPLAQAPHMQRAKCPLLTQRITTATAHHQVAQMSSPHNSTGMARSQLCTLLRLPAPGAIPLPLPLSH